MAHPARLGKFEVRRLLGRGAQSAVYLAHDPDLRREVAIKLLKSNGSGSDTVRREARTVSALRHPNIAPIFELGEHEQRVYLVFEYVEGRTLEQALAQDGAMAPRAAAELLVRILDALALAHGHGIIHRDLKPSNILLDSAGAPRVMDFGIATRPADATGLEPDLTGSPAYMAPEYIAHRKVSEQYDVFSAGLILYEMAFGRRAVQGDSPFQALHQIVNMPLVFPADAQERIGPQLQDVIVKATAKEPELRYSGVRQMQQALQAYLHPDVDAASAAAGAQQSTLEFLLRRMKVKGDFPAMSASIQAIQRMAASNQASMSSLSNSILKDFALTNKILRLVNSAYYATRSGERIRTVSRAIVLMGFDAVRSIAISLTLFDRIADKAHAGLLKDEFLRASLSGLLARELCARVAPARSEEAFICALFHSLGRLLTFYYFKEEAEAIKKLMDSERCTEDAASKRVLGISFEALGAGVAQAWGFPESITQSMRSLPPGKVARAVNADQQLHQLSCLASEACEALEGTDAAGRSRVLAQLAARYGDSLPLSSRDMAQVADSSFHSVGELAQTLNIDLRKTALAKLVSEPAVEKEPAQARTLGGTPGPARAAASSVLVEAVPASDNADPEATLSAGIQDVSKALIEDMPLHDLLRIVAEAVYRALGVRRVVMCTRDARNNTMNGRFGFGTDVEEIARRMVFPLGGNDLFNAILSQDTGVLIRDAAEPKLRSRLPPWFVQHVDAPSFLVFPMNIRKAPVAMIYADADKAGGITVSDKTLALLHTLRNQALLAVKQSAQQSA